MPHLITPSFSYPAVRPGLRLPGPDTFTLEEIKNRPSVLLSVIVLVNSRPLSPSSQYHVCELSGDGVFTPSTYFRAGPKDPEEFCTTFSLLKNKDLFIELLLDVQGSIDTMRDEYKLVVSARECNILETGLEEENTSPVITISGALNN